MFGFSRSQRMLRCGRQLSSAAPRRVASLRSRIANELPLLEDFTHHPFPDQHPHPSYDPPPLPHAPRRSSPLPSPKLHPSLVDSHARGHTYLRLSLTERCSLRCTYCMPAEGVDLTPKPRLLSPQETLRLARMFVRAGVNKIRLTGGEPTVVKGLEEIVRGLNEMREEGLEQIAMTSNGIALPRMLPRLQEAGLDKLNISLDSLHAPLFAKLTRRDALPRVLAAIDLALSLGFSPLKVNCVLMAGVNEHELLDFAAFAIEKQIDVRFIEYMPFDGNQWREAGMVPHARVMRTLREAYPQLSPAGNDPHDVATSWRPFPESRGTVSLISSMTQPFCGGCNRLRLTADGNLKTCLFGSDETSLRDMMREGASDEELLSLVGRALGRKHARHAGMHYQQLVSNENRPMTTIGG